MKELEKEMKDLIKKNLPAQVGETLKGLLEEGEQNKASVKNLEAQVEKLKKTISVHEEIIKEYNKLDERNKNLEARESTVLERERLSDIKALEVQLNTEKEKSKFVFDVTMGLVRNTNYRKNVFDNESQGGYTDSTGRWIQPGSITKNHNEDKSAD